MRQTFVRNGSDEQPGLRAGRCNSWHPWILAINLHKGSQPLQINLVSTRRTISCLAHLRCLERGCLKWPQAGFQKSLKVTSKNFDLPIWCINCQVSLHFSSSSGAESIGEQETTQRCSLWQISASTGIAMSIKI